MYLLKALHVLVVGLLILHYQIYHGSVLSYKLKTFHMRGAKWIRRLPTHLNWVHIVCRLISAAELDKSAQCGACCSGNCLAGDISAGHDCAIDGSARDRFAIGEKGFCRKVNEDRVDLQRRKISMSAWDCALLQSVAVPTKKKHLIHLNLIFLESLHRINAHQRGAWGAPCIYARAHSCTGAYLSSQVSFSHSLGLSFYLNPTHLWNAILRAVLPWIISCTVAVAWVTIRRPHGVWNQRLNAVELSSFCSCFSVLTVARKRATVVITQTVCFVQMLWYLECVPGNNWV